MLAKIIGRIGIMKPICVFGSTFIELLLDIIDFVGIDLVRINFETK